MAKIIKEVFSHFIPNEKRLTPNTPYTKCPKLNPAIQSRLPKQAKEVNKNLVRIQILVLDATAPMISTLEVARKGSLTSKDAAESAQLTLKLLEIA